LVGVKQKHNESATVFVRRFRVTHNKCYKLTIGERDLAELAFAGLNSFLCDMLDGQDFTDVNQLL
jgi:hypothetical protein